VTGPSGNTGFVNLTIQKRIINRWSANIYIDGVSAQKQGFSFDDFNFYVWGETPFSTHQIKIVFAADAPTATPSQTTLFQSLGLVEIATLALILILVASVFTAITLNKRKKAKMG
jgi:hypothetical protein